MNEVEKKIYTVAVDLGTTNVVVIVGAKNDNGTLHFRKVVSRPVEGMQAGQIVNIVAVYNSIHGVMSEIEADLGTRVSQVYTGISGSFIRCEKYTDHVFAQDSQSGISEQDVEALYARMNGVQAPENEIIIERIPQNFKVDSKTIEGDRLVGAFGRQLSATFQFVLCERTPMERLQMLFDKLGIELLGIFPSMLSIVEAVATPEEREEGVAVVNLGGDKTDLAVIHGNTLRYITSIPIGGAAINDDIRTLPVHKQYVEAMKIKYGSAIAEKTERKILPIPGRRPNGAASSILDYSLATAIEARMLDIIDYVKEELKDSGYGKKLGYGLILAGGGSRLANVAELFRRETGMDVRLASTDQINREKNEPESKPAYATAQGILMRGIADGRSKIEGNVRSRIEMAAEAAGEAQRQGVQKEEPAVPVAPVEERSQRTAPAAETTPAASERPQSVKPAAEAEQPRSVNTQNAAAATETAVKTPPQPEQQPQPRPEQPSQPQQPVREQERYDKADNDAGPYGPVGRIHGDDYADDYDDPDKNLTDDDDEPRRRGFFGNLWGRIKGKIEESFDDSDDVSLGSGDNKW